MPAVITNPDTGAVVSHDYEVSAAVFQQQILPPGFPMTNAFGYGGIVTDPGTGNPVFFRGIPGPTFEAIRGIPIHVQWINDITSPQPFPVDPTFGWANPNDIPTPVPPFPPFPPGFPEAQSPVPIVTHLHGGETQSDSDGNPTSWFTAGEMKTGPGFFKSLYTYLNTQQPTTLFYHDHTDGITRLNLYAGLAGFYLLRDPNDPVAPFLPSGKFEIPLSILDRSFNDDGSLLYPNVGNNPDIHPYWVPEFFGNTIVVNGKVWPNLDVERHQYRFRIVNESNARFYNLKLSNNQSFIQIGSDGGYLPKAVELSSLLIAPGERADILVDFSSLAPGTKILLLNDANTPFPGGDAPDINTVGQVMQFTVLDTLPVPPPALPATLNIIPALTPNAPTRTLTLNRVQATNDSKQQLLNGQIFMAPTSEFPVVGSTEDWQIANLTPDTHPIHLHLVEFLLISRQSFDAARYLADWTALNGTLPLDHPTIALPVGPYLQGDPVGPDPNESGWKDTVRMNPGEVTTIRVRFAPQDVPVNGVVPGENLFPFDPAFGPGYVWHCHLIEHEDNSMMRPYQVIFGPSQSAMHD
ncbi:multicopper oxidase domain-containing protein [Paenibacillus donghaensis]|nr:multicopper oxidase domain-containing protein [Paenibacillus donghaensis]